MPYSVINALVVFLAILAIAFIISRKTQKEKDNLANTKKYCETNKFEFIRNMKLEELPEKVRNFSIIQSHVGYKEFHSIVKGNSKGFDFHLLTFIYPGNHSTSGSLICLINKKDANLPKFYLREHKTISDSIGKLFGKEEIKITEDKNFSEKFMLQGENSENTIKFLTEKRRQIFTSEHIEKYEYEADSDYFAISYPLAPSIPVQEYESLLAKTTSILEKLEI
jgi:hypothetical protein